MPNPIKQFFEKKKAEVKFKRAGPGQKLGDSSQDEIRRQEYLARLQQQQWQQQQSGMSRGASAAGTSGRTNAQRQAAEAAMSRSTNKDDEDFEKKRYQAKIQAQVKKELEREKKTDSEVARLRETYGEKATVEFDAPSACKGIFFHCDLIGPEVLPKGEMKNRIREFLYSQLEEEKGLTACLIIHTMAKESEAKVCVETLCKYMDNILENPTEEKFRKIRKTNKAYLERVAGIEGHDLFIQALGFETQAIDGQDFWVYPSDHVTGEDLENIRTLRDALTTSGPIKAELDRDLKVLLPTQASQSFSLPPDFFSLSAEEIRKEQQMKTELLEREGMLRTKAMREREEQREKRLYRYALIRVRFPDGLVLQGTFSVHERYRAVHDYVAEHLEIPAPFVLYESGTRLEVTDYDSALLDLHLAPSTLLIFAWHPEIADEIASQMPEGQQVFLKGEIKALASTN